MSLMGLKSYLIASFFILLAFNNANAKSIYCHLEYFSQRATFNKDVVHDINPGQEKEIVAGTYLLKISLTEKQNNHGQVLTLQLFGKKFGQAVIASDSDDGLSESVQVAFNDDTTKEDFSATCSANQLADKD